MTINRNHYDLTDLIKRAPNRMNRFVLCTRLGTVVLNYHMPKLSLRDQYRIAHRAVRLMVGGCTEEQAIEGAYAAEVDPSTTDVALLHMFANKEEVSFFEVMVRSRVNSLKEKV